MLNMNVFFYLPNKDVQKSQLGLLNRQMSCLYNNLMYNKGVLFVISFWKEVSQYQYFISM